MSGPNEFVKPGWTNRRRIVYGSLLFCAAITLYLTVWGTDDELRQTIASGVLLLAGTVICSYVFGAVIDDKHWMSILASNANRKLPMPTTLRGDQEDVVHGDECVRNAPERGRTGGN